MPHSIAESKWTFAKTYANTWPHEYIVENQVGRGQFAALAIRARGWQTVRACFLTLWKDADPDIPILKEAKAEYAKLQ